MWLLIVANIFTLRSEGSERQEVEFENPDMIILPPPDLYADFGEE